MKKNQLLIIYFLFLFLSAQAQHSCAEIDGTKIDVTKYESYKEDNYLTAFAMSNFKKLGLKMEFKFIDEVELACYVPSKSNYFDGTIYFGKKMLHKTYKTSSGKVLGSQSKKNMFQLVICHEIAHAFIQKKNIVFDVNDKVYQEFLADLLAGYIFLKYNRSIQHSEFNSIASAFATGFSDAEYGNKKHHGNFKARYNYVMGGAHIRSLISNNQDITPSLASKNDRKGVFKNMPNNKWLQMVMGFRHVDENRKAGNAQFGDLILYHNPYGPSPLQSLAYYIRYYNADDYSKRLPF